MCGEWPAAHRHSLSLQPESVEHELLRAFDAFSCVDGVVCGDDSVWLHAAALASCYEPAPSPAHGDTRPAPMLALLAKQRPFIDRLLRDYELRGWLADGFRQGLHEALLARPRQEYAVDMRSRAGDDTIAPGGVPT